MYPSRNEMFETRNSEQNLKLDAWAGERIKELRADNRTSAKIAPVLERGSKNSNRDSITCGPHLTVRRQDQSGQGQRRKQFWNRELMSPLTEQGRRTLLTLVHAENSEILSALVKMPGTLRKCKGKL